MGFLFFLFGLIFGSFYNVLIYRIPRGISFIRGRSFCEACRKTLAPLNLIPVLSFLRLKGQCRSCGAKIPLRYPLIELLTALLFFAAYAGYGLTLHTFLQISFWSMLLIVAMIDHDFGQIDDALLIVFSVIHFVLMIAMQKAPDALLGVAIGESLYFLIHRLTYRIYGREVFGQGDVLLMAACGMVLGGLNALMAAMLAFYIALIGIAVQKLLGKKIRLRDEIAFGPAIAVSAFLVSIVGEQIARIFRFW